jgi:uncharacterized membrane protein
VTPEHDGPIGPPPVLGSWRNVYVLVAVALCVLIALFYALTRWAS